MQQVSTHAHVQDCVHDKLFQVSYKMFDVTLYHFHHMHLNVLFFFKLNPQDSKLLHLSSIRETLFMSCVTDITFSHIRHFLTASSVAPAVALGRPPPHISVINRSPSAWPRSNHLWLQCVLLSGAFIPTLWRVAVSRTLESPSITLKRKGRPPCSIHHTDSAVRSERKDRGRGTLERRVELLLWVYGETLIYHTHV